ncbi:tryptophan 2,3-dioxygenase [Phenylobacterium aquaticum]|uniref:tryptophan 2,3-dioxygenase n=1 Tax=Phenylobacterium aquaticum TaxID=1763816 RepID=UPI001F5CCD20|nr:tryptophan 2,3-dioxygenase family protein [Phenylobacterium aquaticum]MCI3133503.1 tryptophan 2,3-dioxygenase family protein [Phenylobacterium aquaticum]
MTEQIHARPDISYGQYLDLDKLLSAQNPRSPVHDELLFIIIHQASELWLKLSIHELAAARAHIAADDLGPAFKMIARVSRIQGQLIQSWDVLATMTPSEYALIRPHLGQSSGFQSHQYRMLEFLMGAKDADMLRVHEDTPAHAALSTELSAPSLYDECVRLLARRGFAIPAVVLDRDLRTPHEADPAVMTAWAEVYRDPDRHWDLYELAEKLVDLEFRFQQWRFAHLKTVERIIGFKGGTGGSSGATYLARALQASFFPELFQVRTNL